MCFQKDNSHSCSSHYATTPYHLFFDLLTVTIIPYFKAILLYRVFFPSSAANLFHPIFVLALQTVTTLFYCHRSGISFPALCVGSFDLQHVKCFFTNISLITITESFITLLLWHEIITWKRLFPSFLLVLFNALLCLLTFSQFVETHPITL